MKQKFERRFNITELLTLEKLYPIKDDEHVEKVISPLVQEQHYFKKDEFVELCRWKTPRSRRLVQSNSEDFIKEVTHIALTSPSERLRIEVLTLLNGVSWPTASVVLHFGYDNLYPILDFRALWSLGVDAAQVNYNFDFWQEYTQYCRNLAMEVGVSMRVLDRALWQYSKMNQDK